MRRRGWCAGAVRRRRRPDFRRRRGRPWPGFGSRRRGACTPASGMREPAARATLASAGAQFSNGHCFEKLDRGVGASGGVRCTCPAGSAGSGRLARRGEARVAGAGLAVGPARGRGRQLRPGPRKLPLERALTRERRLVILKWFFIHKLDASLQDLLYIAK